MRSPLRPPTTTAFSRATSITPSSSAAHRLAAAFHIRKSYTVAAAAAEPNPPAVNPRWLSDLRARIGRCISFGLRREQQQEAGVVCEELARDWRELVAGSEGFLTEKGRRGLWRHEVVWGEMDSMDKYQLWLKAKTQLMWADGEYASGHVNNVTYNRYAESARILWISNFATHIDPTHRDEWMELGTPKGLGLILRSIRTDYKFPMKFPDRVTVLHKLRSEPSGATDSFILDVVILSELHRRPAARCVEDIVCYDYRQGKKTPLRPFMLEKLRETFRLQEEAKTKWGAKVQELTARVRALEKESWDNPNAKEDMGSAA